MEVREVQAEREVMLQVVMEELEITAQEELAAVILLELAAMALNGMRPTAQVAVAVEAKSVLLLVQVVIMVVLAVASQEVLV